MARRVRVLDGSIDRVAVGFATEAHRDQLDVVRQTPVDPRHQRAVASRSVIAEHLHCVEVRVRSNADGPEFVVQRPDDAGDVRPVAVSVLVIVRVHVVGEVSTAGDPQIAVVGVDPRIEDSHVDFRSVDVDRVGTDSLVPPRGLLGRMGGAVGTVARIQQVQNRRRPIGGYPDAAVVFDERDAEIRA